MFNPIQAIQKNFVVGLLGAGPGGIVAGLLANVGQGGIPGLKGMLDGLKNLFGKAGGQAAAGISPLPMPFSTNNVSLSITMNPVGALQQAAPGASTQDGPAAQAANPFQQLTAALQKLIQALGGQSPSGAAGVAAGGPASGPASGPGAAPAASEPGGLDAMIDKAGSKIDSMMGQAEKLMASDKMQDQLKGQRMMQQAMRMFEMISKMLEKRSELAGKAIQATR